MTDKKPELKVQKIDATENVTIKAEELVNVPEVDEIVPEITKDEILKEDSLVEGIPLKEAVIVEVPADKYSWKSKTSLGQKVLSGEITTIDQILDNGEKILETEIVDSLLPDLNQDLLLIGQAKGKFGGGQRRIFKQSQKKTKEGNKIKFSTFAVVGNENGFVGVGEGRSKETVPSREKAFRRAKLNIIKIKRGCGSWKCNCGESHSIPYEVEGKCGSAVMKIIPAPKGTGLKVEKECAKILKLAGIKDAWSLTMGQTKTKINLIKACNEALKKLNTTKVQQKHIAQLGICSGKLTEQNVDEEFIEEIKHKPEVKV